MPINIGTQLGSYEVTALLGKGGMGEVYRARDTKLKRDVAIKFLPEEFSTDTDRASRFQREAELLASINHPNIGAIYDLEEVNGARFLVLELVEGNTLAERIARGPIPLEDALEIAKQICEALEAAHERGIIHRDLKPANVKITPDGKVKVLDFGLAKAMENAPTNTTLSNSPTMLSGTISGMILGTAAYMSPEQAKGFEVDSRTDTFSFGSVLYEMLIGRQAFQGDTVAEVLASVLVREPDFAALPHNLNPRIVELIRRCLQKNPKRRWQAVGDLRAELETVAANPHLTPATAQPLVQSPPLWKRAIPVMVAAILFTVIGIIADSKLRPSTPAPVTRFSLVLSDTRENLGTVAEVRNIVALSPDGTKLAYIANGTNGQLYLRQMSEWQGRPVPGAVFVTNPFFSPDSQWLAFYSRPERALKKIAVTGGAAVTIARLEAPPIGASWYQDHIVFAALDQGVMRLSENGGEPELLVSTKPPEDGQALSPQIVDNGRTVLFTLAGRSYGPDRWDQGDIVVQSLASRERKVILRGGDAHYFPSGHIIYAVGSNVLAAPFDLKTLKVGGSVSVIEGVMRSGLAQVAFSNNGTVVYIPGEAANAVSRMLDLVDRSGKVQTLPLPPGPYEHPRISPNGKQLAVETNSGKEQFISVYDLSTGASPRRLTFVGNNSVPVWSRDSRYVFFKSERDGTVGIFRQLADGTGTAERFTTAEQGDVRHNPLAIDPLTGKLLLFEKRMGPDSDMWILPLEGDRQPKPFFQKPGFQSYASFAPDGRWVAYMSNELEAVQPQIFVKPFPAADAQYQITTESGGEPIWSPADGKQIFYSWNSQMFAVDVRTEPTFSSGKPAPLPVSGFVQPVGSLRNYDITPDGKQFLVVRPASQGATAQRPGLQLNVVLNWFRELQERVPVK